MDAASFFAAVIEQDAERLREFFVPGADIYWHCTNERFTVEEYVRANCEYPGVWRGELERIERCGEQMITAARVWCADGSASFHVASFFKLTGERILRLDEYWGDDAQAPAWRRDMGIGREIR